MSAHADRHSKKASQELVAAAIEFTPALGVIKGPYSANRAEELKACGRQCSDAHALLSQQSTKLKFKAYTHAYTLVIATDYLSEDDRQALLDDLPGERASNRASTSLHVLRALAPIPPTSDPADRKAALKSLSRLAQLFEWALENVISPKSLFQGLLSGKITVSGALAELRQSKTSQGSDTAEREGSDSAHPAAADHGPSPRSPKGLQFEFGLGVESDLQGSIGDHFALLRRDDPDAPFEVIYAEEIGASEVFGPAKTRPLKLAAGASRVLMKRAGAKEQARKAKSKRGGEA